MVHQPGYNIVGVNIPLILLLRTVPPSSLRLTLCLACNGDDAGLLESLLSSLKHGGSVNIPLILLLRTVPPSSLRLTLCLACNGDDAGLLESLLSSLKHGGSGLYESLLSSLKRGGGISDLHAPKALCW